MNNGSLFGLGPKRAPAPPEPVPLPSIDDATVDARKRAALAELRTRHGRGSTFLSGGPLGEAQGDSYKPMLT